MSRAALILAAGEGTRMKSSLPKVAHPVLGVPMIQLALRGARQAGVEDVVVVVGHGADVVRELVTGEKCALQERQLGTGHAVMSGIDSFGRLDGSLFVLAGDTPLLRPETLRMLAEAREETGAAVALLTARLADPTGYGRIVRDAAGDVAAIVEHKDLAPGQEAIDEVGTGTYCFDGPLLAEHLHKLTTDNAQGEYYLTDMIAHLREEGLRVVAVEAEDPSETVGVNSRVQLAEATKLLQRRINTAHMLAGVTVTDPELAWIGPDVKLGRDVVIEPMTFLVGRTEVGDGSVIGPNARLTDSFVGEGARVDSSVLTDARVGDGATVGPMAYLRPGADLAEKAKAGTFVEIKKSVVGPGSKVPHLSYIGDATIGSGVNVGAGTITCNYDGLHKHRTEIGDGAFIGSDTMLVAPVSVGPGAVTGAGSAISQDVPADALGIERDEQRNVEGWARRRRDKDD